MYENQGFDSEEEFNTAYEEAQLTIETQEPLEEVHNEREEAKKERDESKKAAEETAEDLEVMKYMNENTARIMAARRDYDSQALSDAFNGNVPQSFRNIQRELSQAEEAERNYRTAETNYNNCRERDEPEGCNAGELRTEMNTKKGKWNREKDDVEDAMDSEESRQFMEQHDVGWTSWTRGMQNARRIGTMTTWVYPSQDFGWYSAWFDDILGSDVMNYDQQIEDELCMADVEDVPSTGGVLFVESGGSVRAAAHIEGHRDGPNADNTYSYKITGAVVPAIPNPYGDGFNFQVIVRNPGQQLVNKTKIVESTPGGEQQDGYELFAKSREYTNKPILFQSTTKYTEVCIRFEGSWEDYFGTNNLDDFDSMLCNRIEFVE
ncbi:MAG: hypothetical protein KKG59_01105 [Nanoarchaeota archaeon]|nr:hypothetical protein [Nanoarchaeota archaeon]